MHLTSMWVTDGLNSEAEYLNPAPEVPENLKSRPTQLLTDLKKKKKKQSRERERKGREEGGRKWLVHEAGV